MHTVVARKTKKKEKQKYNQVGDLGNEFLRQHFKVREVIKNGKKVARIDRPDPVDIYYSKRQISADMRAAGKRLYNCYWTIYSGEFGGSNTQNYQVRVDGGKGYFFDTQKEADWFVGCNKTYSTVKRRFNQEEMDLLIKVCCWQKNMTDIHPNSWWKRKKCKQELVRLLDEVVNILKKEREI